MSISGQEPQNVATDLRQNWDSVSSCHTLPHRDARINSIDLTPYIRSRLCDRIRSGPGQANGDSYRLPEAKSRLKRHSPRNTKDS
jgi:hypothetical protein